MRILVKIESAEIADNSMLFFIHGFDSVPRAGDYLRLSNMKKLHEWQEMYNSKIIDFIYSVEWRVKSVTWDFDHHGAFPRLECVNVSDTIAVEEKSH